MAERRITRRRILKTAAVMGAIGAVSSPGVAAAADDGDGRRYRWDIVNVPGIGTVTCVSSGGEAFSRALDNSRITMTGSGTFRDSRRSNRNVSGGGTWMITPGGGSGTYRVTEFVDFELAPGGFPAGFPAAADCIGKPQDARAGLVHLKIRYSDGSEGVLVVSCRLPTTPAVDQARIMEGIVASKGYVEFWNHEEPSAGAQGNRTVFHVLRGDDDDDDDDD